MRVTLLFLLPCTTLAVAPPTVVTTTPSDGASDVDPSLKTITIVFDQKMDQHSGYSVMGGGDSFPTLDGTPEWENPTTFTIPVNLVPDHTYTLQINGTSPQHQKFRAKSSGDPVAPHPIRFTTAPAASTHAAPDITTKNKTAVDRLRTAVLHKYSHIAKTDTDWPSRIDRAEKTLLAARTPQAFATSAAALLKPAEDLHIWLTLDATDTLIGTHSPNTTANLDPAALITNIPTIQKLAPTVLAGQLPNNGPAYLAITSFSNTASNDIDQATDHIRTLDPSKPLILDVRLNGGGNELLARRIAALFTPKPTVYAKHHTLTPSGFSPMQNRTIEPDPASHLHTGEVAVLIGPKNVSSAEAFLLMMRTTPNAVLVGTKTPGTSGNPKPHPLGNGVTLYLPSWQAFLPDGTPLEGHGVSPDIEVPTKNADLSKSDPVLEAAIALLPH